MDEQKMTVTEFVRGLAWHDVGKPFALGGTEHAPLGYWLLKLAGYPQEALAALTHEGKGSWREYLRAKGQGASLPALLLLGNPLDRLAASVYSFYEQPLQAKSHSHQNPFSRLPVELEALQRRFVIPHSQLNKDLEQPWWKAIYDRLPLEWQAALTPEVNQATKNAKSSLSVDLEHLPTDNDALELIRLAMDDYPERTYPPMNDTSLAQHCRLSGILGFVVCSNLKPDAAIWNARIGYEAGNVVPPNIRGDATQRSKVSDGQAIVWDHLNACLVRIVFTGIEDLARRAERVDDVHGALTLAKQFRIAFNAALTEELEVPGLADLLTINESQFDLVYLLPGKETTLRTRVDVAYHNAVQCVADQIIQGRLRRDFPEIAAQAETLIQQLTALSYSTRILPVPTPEGENFDAFAAAYGRTLLEVYLESRKNARTAISTIRLETYAPLSAEDTCEVCGTHPVLEPPPDLAEAALARWLKKRAYAAHTFRGERERLCLSCVARRTLAYGDVAKRMDALTHKMLVPVSGQPGVWQRPSTSPDKRPSTSPDNTLPLPPRLNATVHITSADDLQDIGAFYVRLRHGSKVDLDIFPTTTYAADALGNVVLLSLQPTQALYATYSYVKALAVWEGQPPVEDVAIKGWQQTFVDFYEEEHGKGNVTFAQSIAKVEPHLARVMERTVWIKRFYQALEEELVAAKIRVLPLDVEFPTLRLLVPADQLGQVLHILDKIVTTVLFSAEMPDSLDTREDLHALLELLLPDLLHGAVILFKHKFPLYLALDAERDLFRKLDARDCVKGEHEADQTDCQKVYGFHLGFSDLRGALSEVGPLDATVTYAQLGQVLELVEHVDRPTLLQYAETRQYLSPELAQAQAVVRANRINRTQVSYVEQLQDEVLFDAVYFITRAIRR